MELYLATHNPNKVEGFKKILHYYGNKYKVEFKTLPKGIKEPDEGIVSLAENATIKATYYAKKIGKPVMSDDSGFFVDAFDGAPGVLARRWSEETNETLWGKTLRLLGDNPNRKAKIITSLCYHIPEGSPISGSIIKTEVVEGTISKENHAPPKHTGYDGIFIPKGTSKTLIQLSDRERWSPKCLSRSKAFLALLKDLNPVK